MKIKDRIQLLDHFYFFEEPEIQMDYMITLHNVVHNWLTKNGYNTEYKVNDMPFTSDKTKILPEPFHTNEMNYVIVTTFNQNWLLNLFVEDIKNTLDIWKLHYPETFIVKNN